MELAPVFFVGLFLGIVMTSIIFATRLVGTLRIDKSIPDETYMFLELNKGMSQISSKKHVVLKVKLEDYISHK